MRTHHTRERERRTPRTNDSFWELCLCCCAYYESRDPRSCLTPSDETEDKVPFLRCRLAVLVSFCCTPVQSLVLLCVSRACLSTSHNRTVLYADVCFILLVAPRPRVKVCCLCVFMSRLVLTLVRPPCLPLPVVCFVSDSSWMNNKQNKHNTC